MPQLEGPTIKNIQLCTRGLWGEKGKRKRVLAFGILPSSSVDSGPVFYHAPQSVSAQTTLAPKRPQARRKPVPGLLTVPVEGLWRCRRWEDLPGKPQWAPSVGKIETVTKPVVMCSPTVSSSYQWPWDYLCYVFTFFFEIFFFFFSLILPKAPQHIVVYSSRGSFWLCYEAGRRLGMAWWAVLGSCPGSEQAKPWAIEAEHTNLTTWPQSRPLRFFLWSSLNQLWISQGGF